MRFEGGKSNTEIGQYFHISRERVRQLIGNTGKLFRKNWTIAKINSGDINLADMTRSEVKELPGLTSEWLRRFEKTRHRIKTGGYAKRGHDFEDRASKILSDAGINNKLMSFRHPFDILIDGRIKVDVKSVFVSASKYPSQKCVSPAYAISNLKSGKDCDFFFAFVPDPTEPSGFTYFVIPSFEAFDYASTSKIRIVWPVLGQKFSKWEKYHKRLDLLK